MGGGARKVSAEFDQFSESENLNIVEDSCQSLGASYKRRQAGTFGKAGTFSFFPAKTLGCFGDGGAIITNDEEIAEKLKIIRDHGRDSSDGKVKLYGFNGRLDNIHAAILDKKLEFYDQDINRRREIASIYQENLQNLDALKGGVVGTVMSNIGLEIALNKLEIPFLRTSVGDQNIIKKLHLSLIHI